MSRRTDTRDISNASDHVLKNVRGFVGGVEELLRATAHFSGEGLAAARSRVEGQVEDLRESIGDAQAFALDQTRRAAHDTDRYVHKKPWQAIGIAMAAGVVLGYLSNRR
ncbi:MAG TPA: DUF883 family protein [Verrucomicrobiae bacterium]|nr:DUF883 family protein [Verrucomicrobiae bacterium]